MMGSKGKLSGTEVDAFSAWRKYIAFYKRPGIRKWIKRHFWKKQRAKNRSERLRDDEPA